MQKASTKKTAWARNPLEVLLAVLMAVSGIYIGIRSFGSARPCLGTLQNNCEVRYETAATTAEHQRGLSGRSGLPFNSGILFVFNDEREHCFWMKDMKFSIDIVWLDKSRNIVHMAENAAPSSYPDSFCPDKPSKFVVEVSSGRASELGWSVGQNLQF